jgi:hypothetical protein
MAQQTLTPETRPYRIPDYDWTKDEWNEEEKNAVLFWYMNGHGTGDTAQARFAPFMLRYNPLGFRTFRRHVRYFGGGTPIGLLFVHTYAAVGKGDNCLYQIVTARQAGLSRAQVIEAINFAWLTAGPTMNAAAEACGPYLFAWDDQRQSGTFKWPDGWATGNELMRSGIDTSTDDFTSDEVDKLEAWHSRMTGSAPRWIRSWARLQPRAYKTTRIRYEKGFGVTLPVQMFPLFTLHLSTYLGRAESARQAVLQAKAFGVKRREILGTMESAFVTGGEPLMSDVLTDGVIDAIESVDE